jgi:hypothetical protein
MYSNFKPAIVFLSLVCIAGGFHINVSTNKLTPERSADAGVDQYHDKNETRRDFVLQFGLFSMVALTIDPKGSNALASYSSNARNLERINSGDYSGGSIYDNNPKSESGKKRRAMVGCKNSVAREEAASLLQVTELSEKDCNNKVLGAGESEFMLQALRNLDCPTCPYGIKSER